MSSEPLSHPERSCRSNAATECCFLPVIVMTNQSGVARGYFPEQFVRDVHERMMAEREEAGARPDGVYYCPHVAEDACEGRKSKIGMLEQAARDLGLDLKNSFVAIDRHGDVEVAHCAGARSVLVGTGYGAGEFAWHRKSWPRPPEFVAADLPEAADWILKEVQR
jgi:D-glycero-D-manno-heptose 1,7-bisphosphate phosphatase